MLFQENLVLHFLPFEYWNLNSVFSRIWVTQVKLFFVNSVNNFFNSTRVAMESHDADSSDMGHICFYSEYAYFRWSQCAVKPVVSFEFQGQEHTNAFFWKRVLFDKFHTKTPVWKLFQKWSLHKMHYSENTLFLLWTGENGDEQSVKYFLSISVSRCFF